MASSTPLQSFLGGVSLSIPVHSLLLVNGNVFGISGYVHRAAKGSLEAIMAVAGLILGGMAVGALEGMGPATVPLPLPLSQIALAGLLVGIGSKLSNGCTSGHMICGMARFSLRSICATATFFTTGVLTSHLVHKDLPAIESTADLTLGDNGFKLLAFQVLPFAVAAAMYIYVPAEDKQSTLPDSQHETDISKLTPQIAPRSLLRGFVYLATSFQFAVALRLSNLTDPRRVVAFLLLPIHRAFDPSLFFLAMGALPLAMYLYRYARRDEKPLLGGIWSIPKGGKIDGRLLLGAAIFGVGWGLAGVCPGPGLVNLGRSLASGSDLTQGVTWVSALVLGGLLI